MVHLSEHAKMTARGLAYELTQWLMDRGFVSDADGRYAITAIEDLISGYLETHLKRMVKEAQQARDAAAKEFR